MLQVRGETEKELCTCSCYYCLESSPSSLGSFLIFQISIERSTLTDRPFLTTLSQVISFSSWNTHTHRHIDTHAPTQTHVHTCTYTWTYLCMHITHMNTHVQVHHCHHPYHSYVHSYGSATYFLNSSCSIHYHHLFVYMCSICFLCLNVTFTNIRVLFALCIVTSQATSPVPSTLQALTKNCCMLNEPSKISLILNRFWKQKSSPLIKQKNKNRKGLFERKD